MENEYDIRKEIMEEYPDVEFLFAEGFDDALIGIDAVSGVLVYSKDIALNILMNRDGMTYEDALEYFEFNVSGSYMGSLTPSWIEYPFCMEPRKLTSIHRITNNIDTEQP